MKRIVSLILIGLLVASGVDAMAQSKGKKSFKCPELNSVGLIFFSLLLHRLEPDFLGALGIRKDS